MFLKRGIPINISLFSYFPVRRQKHRTERSDTPKTTFRSWVSDEMDGIKFPKCDPINKGYLWWFYGGFGKLFTNSDHISGRVFTVFEICMRHISVWKIFWYALSSDCRIYFQDLLWEVTERMIKIFCVISNVPEAFHYDFFKFTWLPVLHYLSRHEYVLNSLKCRTINYA